MNSKNKNKYQWNLGLLYRNDKDPQIEKDLHDIERLCAEFAKKYDLKEKAYVKDESALFKALTDYESLLAKTSGKPLIYFHYRQHMNAEDRIATEKISLFTNRLTVAGNLLQFFVISLGTINATKQKKFLASKKLAYFRILLDRIFADARHILSEPEEKILSLKSLPAYALWVQGNEKLLGSKFVLWQGKKMPLSEAFNVCLSLEKKSDRHALAGLIRTVLKENSAFAESELNAVITDKKIEDELRGYPNAYDATVQSYRNDPAVVLKLVETVTKHFSIPQKYYRLKARLMSQGALNQSKKPKEMKEKTKEKIREKGITIAYEDRSVKMGRISRSFSIEECVKNLRETFGGIDPKFTRILESYMEKGQIDFKPRQGKMGGGYCWGTYGNPTFVLLNHVDTFDSFKTFAHEMGHAFHGELSVGRGPIYSDYSTSLAETASTLFEQIAFEAIFEKLSDAEKIVALEQKLNSEMSTIFRQIACFNFEKEIHAGIKAKGFLSKEELAALHNKHMQLYLGDAIVMHPDDGYFFIAWSHLRRFFYVYSYAYGMLVSKALLRRYKKDRSFWKKIEEFLSAGGSDSPEQIIKSIGIDVSKPDFWQDGLREIEDDVARLEKLTRS